MCNARNPDEGEPGCATPLSDRRRCRPGKGGSVRYDAYTLSLPECAVTDVVQVVALHLGEGAAAVEDPGRDMASLAVHQQVPADFRLLDIQLDDRALEHSIAVDAAGVEGKRPAHFLDPPALVDVAVY